MNTPNGPHFHNKDPNFECLIFDLDDTLYPASTELMSACTNFILDYVQQGLHIDAKTSEDVCGKLYKVHGSTLAGLVASGYKCDFTEFNRYMHARLPYENLLHHDMKLRELLLTIPQRKVVFTNGSKEHAYQCLKQLGLQDCFEQMICFDNLNPTNNFKSSLPVVCKPSPKAYHRALQIFGADVSKTLFFDDSPKNIEVAKSMGLWTCLVGSSAKTKGADYAVESIHDIKDAIPDIYFDKGKEHNFGFE